MFLRNFYVPIILFLHQLSLQFIYNFLFFFLRTLISYLLYTFSYTATLFIKSYVLSSTQRLPGRDRYLSDKVAFCIPLFVYFTVYAYIWCTNKEYLYLYLYISKMAM